MLKERKGDLEQFKKIHMCHSTNLAKMSALCLISHSFVCVLFWFCFFTYLVVIPCEFSNVRYELWLKKVWETLYVVQRWDSLYGPQRVLKLVRRAG